MASFDEGKKMWTLSKVSKAAEPITISGAAINHKIYIVDCTEVTVVIEGKVQAVAIDSCKKSQVVMDKVIGGVEVSNSSSIKFQVSGSCPTASVDKTDGCTIYLMSDEAKAMQLSTAKHSDVQISFPDGDDMKEVPVPEQFVHTLSGDALTSKVSDLYA